MDDLPENSPINIVQTPIPITTSVPKRAKSQKKKALAAALATAQEYSEISMEQKKLQVCSTTPRTPSKEVLLLFIMARIFFPANHSLHLSVCGVDVTGGSVKSSWEEEQNPSSVRFG